MGSFKVMRIIIVVVIWNVFLFSRVESFNSKGIRALDNGSLNKIIFLVKSITMRILST